MKKKIIISLCCICAVFVGVLAGKMPSKASSAEISLKADSQTVKKEQEFSVYVTVTADAAIQNIDTMFGYDAEILEYVSSDSSAVAGASGKLHIMEDFTEPVNSVTYTLKFRALEVGDCMLGVSETYISEAETFNIVPVSSANMTVTVITNRQESAEARLKELLVAPGSMNESFDSDVYIYTVKAAYEDENVAVSAIPADENAVVAMEKADTLNVGENYVVITVTAPAGNTAVYTVIIDRSSIPSQAETDVPAETEVQSETDAPVETDAQGETDAPVETDDPAGTNVQDETDETDGGNV